jgi:hypothetical protein
MNDVRIMIIHQCDDGQLQAMFGVRWQTWISVPSVLAMPPESCPHSQCKDRPTFNDNHVISRHQLCMPFL